MDTTCDDVGLPRPRLIRVCRVDRSAPTDHRVKSHLPCVPLSNGVDGEQAKAATVAQQTPRAEKEIRDEIGRATPTLGNVSYEPVAVGVASDAGDSFATEERRVTDDRVEAWRGALEHIG